MSNFVLDFKNRNIKHMWLKKTPKENLNYI